MTPPPQVTQLVRSTTSEADTERFEQFERVLLAHEDRNRCHRPVFLAEALDRGQPVVVAVDVIIGQDDPILRGVFQRERDGVCLPRTAFGVAGDEQFGCLGKIRARNRIALAVTDDEELVIGLELASQLFTGLRPLERRQNNTRHRLLYTSPTDNSVGGAKRVSRIASTIPLSRPSIHEPSTSDATTSRYSQRDDRPQQFCDATASRCRIHVENVRVLEGSSECTELLDSVAIRHVGVRCERRCIGRWLVHRFRVATRSRHVSVTPAWRTANAIGKCDGF
ncbi:hypothetical protein C494_13266 [Natronorubrum bangense JCM 10635]|uniref:Uncharacterized protein n=1 Tax=Natronorubrum bangense JCM 10635 TaxID=1227500 RepID=L9WCI0_9EURY|nr:hypothetical protein C494_13266 [Natronorubrum bangense JCM 10635]